MELVMLLTTYQIKYVSSKTEDMDIKILNVITGINELVINNK